MCWTPTANRPLRVRRLRPGHREIPELELSLHPGWQHLLGEPLQLLLEQRASGLGEVLIRSDVLQHEHNQWLQSPAWPPRAKRW